NLADFPWYVHAIPMLYFVLYTFLLRQLVLDLTRSRDNPKRRRLVEAAYVVLTLALYAATWLLHLQERRSRRDRIYCTFRRILPSLMRASSSSPRATSPTARTTRPSSCCRIAYPRATVANGLIADSDRASSRSRAASRSCRRCRAAR